MAALDEVFEDLDGFGWIPGIGQILDGARTLQTAIRDGQVDADATQTALTIFANPHGPDLVEVLSLLVQELTNPRTNPALAVLPDEPRKTVQQLGEVHVLETAYAPRDCPNEAAGLISEHTPTNGEGRCQAVTDAEREELRRKVAEANKRSENNRR
jgi:hypothetical protein